jgi:hypothetical protein
MTATITSRTAFRLATYTPAMERLVARNGGRGVGLCNATGRWDDNGTHIRVTAYRADYAGLMRALRGMGLSA